MELTSKEKERRNNLVQKLKQGKISLDEAGELKSLMEREKTYSSSIGTIWHSSQ
jgi:hypothetical protein